MSAECARVHKRPQTTRLEAFFMALHKPQQMDTAHFRAQVVEGQKTALVCFCEEWSQPCRDMAPVLEALCERYYGTVGVFMMDLEEASLPAAEYAVASIPTVLLFVGGVLVERVVGVRSYEEIEKRIMQYL